MALSSRNIFTWIIIFILIFLIIAKLVQNAQASQVCGANPPGDLVGPPSVTAQTIYQVFNGQTSLGGNTGVNTPDELKTMAAAQHIYNDSVQYQIDDAFALADWNAESNYGTAGVAARTKNIGNITITDLNPDDWKTWTPSPIGTVDTNGLHFPIYSTWLDGIDAWFDRVKGYTDDGITDLEHFTLYYVHGVHSRDELPPGGSSDVDTYINNLQTGIGNWRLAQASVQQTSGINNTFTSTFVDQLPGGSWATQDALQGGEQLGIFNCTQTTSMVGSAIRMALHLTGTTDGAYTRWAAGTPQPPAETLNAEGHPWYGDGVVWCTNFVSSTYRDFTGEIPPWRGDAWTWWDHYQGLPGFQVIAASKTADENVPGGLPRPGDIVVLWDGDLGHVAVIVGVQLPVGNQDGFMIIAQGHATSVLDKWIISASDWKVHTGWSYNPTVKGYIRVLANNNT